MLNPRRASAGAPAETSRPPPKEEPARKQRVLTRGTPSITRSSAYVIVLKSEDLFLLTEPDGRVPLEDQHGFGLYYHDCRYLNGYELRLAGAHPVEAGSGCRPVNDSRQAGG